MEFQDLCLRIPPACRHVFTDGLRCGKDSGRMTRKRSAKASKGGRTRAAVSAVSQLFVRDRRAAALRLRESSLGGIVLFCLAWFSPAFARLCFAAPVSAV